MDPEVFRLLAILSRPLSGEAEFARRLLASADSYLRPAGFAALLDLGAVTREQSEDIVTESRHGMVASRAFRFFIANLEYELAERVAAAFEPHDKPAAAEGMRAYLDHDPGRLIDVSARQFLSEGRVEHLLAAAEQGEAAGGWRNAIIWVARATVLQPTNSARAWSLLRLLETARQFDAVAEILEIFRKGRFFPEISLIFNASLAVHAKDPEKALKTLASIRVDDIKGGQIVKTRICHIRAEAHEALKNYPEALKWYREANKQDMPKDVDKRAFLKSIQRLAAFDYPALSPDPHINHFMMLGFPRSGTTLLENALSAHPEIETFEEVPAQARMIVALEQVLAARPIDGGTEREALERVRSVYYRELDRRSSKAGARVFVDKLPIRTAWIELLEKFFPEKRYIFSIRHPYDVVLSCFRQSFKPNAAMENFRTLEDSCDFYDRVMTTWFKAFPADSERVLYVRYDALVTAFEAEMRRTLQFLGVPWNDDVLHFSERAGDRKITTPSQSKVLTGLSLGLQSSWRNYRSVFDTPHGAKLHKWVDRFGYER